MHMRRRNENVLARNATRETEQMSNVTHPAHYNAGRIEVIEAIEDWRVGFHLGNAIKYIARAGKKDPAKTIEDLEKATWYIRRFIEIQGESPRRPNDMNPRVPAESPSTPIKAD